MKPNQEPENSRALDKTLEQWVVDAPLPPRFQEQVWQRIAQAEAKPVPSFQAVFLRLLEVVMPQPKIAFSYVTALLVLGVAAGSSMSHCWRAQ